MISLISLVFSEDIVDASDQHFVFLHAHQGLSDEIILDLELTVIYAQSSFQF